MSASTVALLRQASDRFGELAQVDGISPELRGALGVLSEQMLAESRVVAGGSPPHFGFLRAARYVLGIES